MREFHALREAGVALGKLVFALNHVTPAEEMDARAYLAEAGYAGLANFSVTDTVFPVTDSLKDRSPRSDVAATLDERGRRLHAAAEALTAGRGGVAATSRAAKVARSTIGRGIKDLREPGSLAGKVRREGAGRPAITAKDPTLLDRLVALGGVRELTGRSTFRLYGL